MADMIFNELGFPVLLVNVPLVEVRGHLVPDVNMKALQASAFAMLVTKPARLTAPRYGSSASTSGFGRRTWPRCSNMANHSVVSQWESREDEPTGMDYNTEVLLRLWMAGRSGQADRLVELLESKLKNLEHRGKPLEVLALHAA
jgi:hypothetical protein